MLYRSVPGPALARLERPRTAKPTSLAVVADAHVTPWATGTWKVYHRTAQRLGQAIEDANRLDVDAVVFAGDLTKDGRVGSFDRVEELLAACQSPSLAVPGNHDVPKPFDTYRTPDVEAFARRFSGGRLPFVEHVGGLDVVGIDTATTPDGRLQDSHGGYVSADQLDWLDSILPGLEHPVVVGHHPLSGGAASAEGFSTETDAHVGNAGEVASVLADGGVECYLCGHAHWPATTTVAGVREVVAPATCSVPQSFLHLQVDSNGLTVDVVPLADRAGFEEAYAYARNGTDRGQAVADRIDRGVLTRLPLVEEHVEPATVAAGDTAVQEH